MIKSILIALCTVLLCWNSIPAEAQTPQDSVRFIGYLPVRHTDPTKWITRYQSEIDRYQTENQMLKDTSCDVLFLGSSSINLWDNIYRDMAPLKILRRSYGGAALRDMLSYKPSLARKEMIPKHEIINALLQEYASKREGLTYIDVASCLYDNNGKLRKDIFKQDGLHMNQNGYDLWTAILKPKILESIR